MALDPDLPLLVTLARLVDRNGPGAYEDVLSKVSSERLRYIGGLIARGEGGVPPEAVPF
jgi:hypothetical protein